MNYFIIATISYLLGNLSFAYILGKLIKKQDVRDYGSGNAGTTNAIRTFGKKIGALVFIGDVLKAVVAVLIGKSFGDEIGSYIAGILVIVGHNWPVFLGFKGGKGVASTIGVLVTITPLVTLICVVIGVTIIIFTRTVSIGSIVGMSLSPIVSLVFVRPLDIKLTVFCLILSSMSIYRHKSNIKKLMEGKENKF